jgi:hypothetical protein
LRNRCQSVEEGCWVTPVSPFGLVASCLVRWVVSGTPVHKGLGNGSLSLLSRARNTYLAEFVVGSKLSFQGREIERQVILVQEVGLPNVPWRFPFLDALGDFEAHLFPVVQANDIHFGAVAPVVDRAKP